MSTTTTKERHYAHLAARLNALSNNLANTHHHIGVAAEQAVYLRKLGASQGAVFMAALDQVDREGAAGYDDSQVQGTSDADATAQRKA
ncbi:DASH complex subunit Hsk3 like [Ceraceosorus bombacis]|uniref:DASH complex subunit Hsk3 like n=1 Tax=Ceraceosorus bombacis TaxID=401625 RepID=A0A0P1BKY2_9BASI|nr:DASH complex subunit Hsk3 like [Ceraceosorus bombacis]